MTKTLIFNSNYQLGATLPNFTEDEIKNEPMFFASTPEFVYEHGGPISKAFVDALLSHGERPTAIFTRIHLLERGHIPCKPGWHLDDLPLNADGNADYSVSADRYCLALINGDVAPTEFALGDLEMPVEGNPYHHWCEATPRLISEGRVLSANAPSNRLVFYDRYAMHRGVAAVKKGWRWFGRASYGPDKVANEIRRQVHVYIPYAP